MKLSVFLVVVLVSTAFASPHFLRSRGRGDGKGGKRPPPPPSSGENKQGTNRGPGGDGGEYDKQSGDILDENRWGPCEKVIRKCDGPPDDADKQTRSEDIDQKDIDECKVKLEENVGEIEKNMSRRDTGDSANIDAIKENVGKCKERLEKCLIPPAERELERLLRGMLRRDGDDNQALDDTDGICQKVEEQIDDQLDGPESEETDEEPEGPPQNENEYLRNLLLELLSKK